MDNVFQWTQNWTKLQEDLICHSFDSLPSTNSYAKSLPVESKNQIVLADIQPEGRGRGTHTWTSPQTGQALLSSWVFDLDFSPQPILSPLVGLSIFEALHEIRGFKNISIKAPNDIYLSDKKVCGVLIENQSQGNKTRCIVGVGINVLSHPSINLSGSLSEHRQEPMDLCVWGGFLIEFYKRLKESIAFSKNALLTNQQCDKILTALNQNPNFQYEQVLNDGSLKTKDQTVSWFDL